MGKLRQLWKQYQYLLVSIAAFLVAGLLFLDGLLHNLDLLRCVNAVILVLVGVRYLKLYNDGSPEE